MLPQPSSPINQPILLCIPRPASLHASLHTQQQCASFQLAWIPNPPDSVSFPYCFANSGSMACSPCTISIITDQATASDTDPMRRELRSWMLGEPTNSGFGSNAGWDMLDRRADVGDYAANKDDGATKGLRRGIFRRALLPLADHGASALKYPGRSLWTLHSQLSHLLKVLLQSRADVHWQRMYMRVLVRDCQDRLVCHDTCCTDAIGASALLCSRPTTDDTVYSISTEPSAS